MQLQKYDQKTQYESILEASQKGELWSPKPCMTTACSSEGPIKLKWFKKSRQKDALETEL